MFLIYCRRRMKRRKKEFASSGQHASNNKVTDMYNRAQHSMYSTVNKVRKIQKLTRFQKIRRKFQFANIF